MNEYTLIPEPESTERVVSETRALLARVPA